MKQFFILSTLLLTSINSFCQHTKSNTYSQKQTLLEDKQALRELVDDISILTDDKNTSLQVLLFTENATMESYQDSQLLSKRSGRKQITEFFNEYLDLFETTYHTNGQQKLTIKGNKATGVTYCQAVLISKQDGHHLRTTSGIIYYDTYVKEKGKWYITKRITNIRWSDVKELKIGQ